MSTAWTKSQDSAIKLRNGMLVVSAAAGSGKTAVLVERVIQIITDEVHKTLADKLLIVTFTTAAASELRHKLNKELRKVLDNNPTNTYYINQQMRLQRATISTIDSFLSSILKEYFYEININRDFRIASQSEIQMAKDDAYELTLDTFYSNEEDEDFKLIIRTFCKEYKDIDLKESIFKIHTFLTQHPFRNKWLSDKLSLFDVKDLNDSVWFSDIICPYLTEVSEYLIKLAKSLQYFLVEADEKVVEKSKSSVEYHVEYAKEFSKVVKLCDYDKIYNYICSYAPPKHNTPKGYADDPVNVLIKDIKTKFKDVLVKDVLNIIFDGPKEQHIFDIKHLGKIASKLFEIVKEFDDNYCAIKENKNIAEFSDLSRWAIRLLYNEDSFDLTDIALELRNRYSYILVDEYQDSNDVQDYIFKAISKGEFDENLFVVGDVKQCIYAFREAKPDIFVKRRDSASRYEGEEKYPASVILDKNFRSSKKIIDFVNFTFKNLMSKSIGSIEYNKDEALVYNENREQLFESVVELDYVKYDKIKLEAEGKFFADKIKEIIESRVQVKTKNSRGEDTTRDIKLGDIAILCRYDAGYSVKLSKELKKYGINAYSNKSDEFLLSQEIQIITNFLKTIDNPNLDIELMSVLMSPIYGFSSEDLARLRNSNTKRKRSLYSCLKDDARAGNEKSKAFLEELDYYREKSVTSSISELINLIYDRTSYDSILSAMTESTLSKANLRLFSIYARDFEQNTHKGLPMFLSYLSKTIALKKDLDSAVDIGTSQGDAVVIMTIHSSKGLEWPVVMIGNLEHKFNSNKSKNLLLDSNYGFATKRKDIETNVVFDTLPRKALSINQETIEKSEEIRILYVGLTRAKDQLIMSIPIKKIYDGETDVTMERYVDKIFNKMLGSSKISPFDVRKVQKLSDLISMIALIHPSADKLRNYSEYDISVDYSTESELAINIIDSDISKEIVIDSSSASDKNIIPNTKIAEILSSRKTFEYKYKEILDIQSKIVVTELAHNESSFDFDSILRRPVIMQKEKLTGADKGTAFHMLAQYVDYEAARVDLEKEINRLVNSGYISTLQANSIDRQDAKKFFESELVTRVINSQRVEREYQFSILIRPNMVNKNIPPEYGNQKILLNGSVDLAFWENGEIVIVDYKTDKIDNIDELCEKYQYQVKYYEKALNDVTGNNVKQCYIYSVYLGQCKEIKYIE